MLLRIRSTKLWSSQRPPLFTTSRGCIKRTFSSSFEFKVLLSVNKDYDDNFLPWLERKARVEISFVLSIGKIAYGRSLFASKNIQVGDYTLRVPYNMQLLSDDLLPELKFLLGNEVGNVTKRALIVLSEKRKGKNSEWAPYISRLPQLVEIHNTIFWSEEELDMIFQSSLYQETIYKKVQIEKEFLAIKPALDRFPKVFDQTTFKNFVQAYASVESRAWRSLNTVSLIFLNHDGFSEAIMVSAGRDYASGEEVKIQISIPQDDPLCKMKLELLQNNRLPMIENIKSPGDYFSIKEVKSIIEKRKGLPQSLRAFARVLCCTSSQELRDLAIKAAQNDGWLARRPLRNCSQEIRAHQLLLSQIIQLTEKYDASINKLESANSSSISERHALRKQMARDLLTGELRILNSASAWLRNYCATLT